MAPPGPIKPLSLQPRGETNDEHTIALIGDEQVHWEEDIRTAIGSLAVNSEAPCCRPPGTTLGVLHTTEMMLRELIPPAQRAFYQGHISTGDVADIANTEEIKSFFDVVDRLKKADPMERMLLFMIGNHDVFHRGTTRSGSDFLGLLGFILNLQGGRTYKRDIHLPEVGDPDNILDKKVLLAFLYEQFFGKSLDPVILAPTDATGYYISEEHGLGRWKKSGQAFKHFWKQEKDGSWNALVFLDSNAKKPHPEEQWMHVSAIKMSELSTADGKVPIFFISLDTMDFLADQTSFGGTRGRVSHYQVNIVDTFITEMKRRHPKARFIMGGHFPAHDIVGIRGSKLNHVLAREEVVAYIAGHTHSRGYRDLAAKPHRRKLGIRRDNPLPQVIVPAVMDYPNEMALMRYGVDPADRDKIFFEFDFKRLDEDKIPGNSDVVCEELKMVRPHLLTYDDAMAHMGDKQLKEFATPGTTIGKKIDLLLNLDHGIITKPGRVYDEVVAKDVIPAMVEDTQTYLRLFRSVIKVSLVEGGFREEAANYCGIFFQTLEHLDDYYERITQGKYTDTSGEHSDVHLIDRFKRDLDEASYDLIDKLEAAEQETKDPQMRQLYHNVAHIVRDVNNFMNDYRHWLTGYEQNLRTERRPSELINETDLLGSPYFKSVVRHIWELPYGSQAVAFLTHVHLESAEQYKEFYKGKESLRQKVPDQIRVEHSVKSGKTTIKKQWLSGTHTATRRHWCETDADYKPHAATARAEVMKEVPKSGKYKPDAHWSVEIGGYLGNPNDGGVEKGVRVSVGGQWHLLSRWNAPRINGGIWAVGNLDFQG